MRKFRTGENAALWRGHLDKLLPKQSKVQKVKHFPALTYTELPAFYSDLRKKNTLAAKALTLIILTASRSNEALGAQWNEIDMEAGIWIIPENRMKAGVEHRVPLTHEALTLLKELKTYQVNDDNRVFPGLREDKTISDSTVRKLVKVKDSSLTIHGFRSTFRDWCAEMTSFPERLAETALAHKIINATQAAYERGDKFEKRRKLMEAWTNYCLSDQPKSIVTLIKKQA